MYGLRKVISGGAVASVAVLGSLVIASAPAASGGNAQRSLLTGTASRDQPPQMVDVVRVSSIRRVPASAKPDGTLAHEIRAGDLRGAHEIRPAGLATTGGGLVRVIVESRRPKLVRAGVQGLGGRVERTMGSLVQAVIAPRNLAALSRRPEVGRVRAPFAHFEAAVTGEEVSASLAVAWHDEGFTGKGVKVAVIDAGFAGLAELQAVGELPANVVEKDFCGGGFATVTAHGTAVAEIVHEMAPDAELHLLCVETEVDLAAAASFAKSQGVGVITHSVGWEGPYRDDGSGPVGAIVTDARANGILWVNAAGNGAQTHWSGPYNSGGGLHLWSSSGDLGNSFVWPNDSRICGFLKWDEWPAAVSDFDLGLFLSEANVLLASSEEEQGESQPPFEALCVSQSTGSDLVVYWAIRGYRVTTSPRLDLVSWSSPLEYQTAAGSIASPASSPSAFAVGALCWQSRELEPYSSQGPTIDGRTKPDIVGHDSVSSGTYGASASCSSAFAGTSASAPEVAGAAALVKQAYPKFGPDEIEQLLIRSARDLGAPGVDNTYGAGELRLPKPPDVIAPTATALASTGRPGKNVKLLSRVSDDSGEVSVVELVKLRGKTVASMKRSGFVSAVSPKTVAVLWKAPANAKGAYLHCVRAIDRAGNSSPLSCAEVAVK